jgi:tRNA threonylcarbamoyladenosine biosynthesis protein TsaB
MKVIGIETSNIIGGVAFLDSDKGKAKEFTFKRGMVHGKLLAPSIDKGMRKLKWNFSDIDLISVDVGPGSYTGLRVGVATAKALVYAINVLNQEKGRKTKTILVGVSSLDAMAQNIPPKHEFICPVIDARWKQVYTAIYKKVEGEYKRITDYLPILPEDLVKILPESIFMFGDGLSRYKDIFAGKGVTFGAENGWFPRAKYIAQLGLNMFKEGKRDNPLKLVPSYLRATEAEMKRKESLIGRR